jgi:erythrocyte band 7 integral membrane protein
MATEAEATREARAKVIAAEGEQRAAKAIKGAADVLGTSPFAIQLRYLQTLNSIAAEKNSTIIFPVPLDLLEVFGKRAERKSH